MCGVEDRLQSSERRAREKWGKSDGWGVVVDVAEAEAKTPAASNVQTHDF